MPPTLRTRDANPRGALRSRRRAPCFFWREVLSGGERRDRKGLYRLAREGKIKEFTGISDPYDVPETPELRLDTENVEVDHCAHQVLLKLEQMGLVRG